MEPHDLTLDPSTHEPLDWEDVSPASRARLFAVLGWAAAGFTAVAVLAALISRAVSARVPPYKAQTAHGRPCRARGRPH